MFLSNLLFRRVVMLYKVCTHNPSLGPKIAKLKGLLINFHHGKNKESHPGKIYNRSTFFLTTLQNEKYRSHWRSYSEGSCQSLS